MVLYDRSATNLQQQIAILKRRQLKINDTKTTRNRIQDIGYFKLKGYCIPFYSKKDYFRSNTSFNTVYSAYKLDEKMRIILFPMLQRIEVQFKALLGSYLGTKYGPLGYLNTPMFATFAGESEWLACIKRNEKRGRKRNEAYICHYQNEYDDKFPIWVAIEMSSLGDVSKLYSNIKTNDKKNFAMKYYHMNYQKLSNWLQVITIIRNICAHNARLFSKKIPLNIYINRYDHISKNNSKTLFGVLYICKTLLMGTDFFQYQIINLKQVLKQTPFQGFYEYGLPDDWCQKLLEKE